MNFRYFESFIITHVVILLYTIQQYLENDGIMCIRKSKQKYYFISSVTVRYGYTYFCVYSYFICSIVFFIYNNTTTIDIISFNEHNIISLRLYQRCSSAYRKRKYITNLTLTCFTSLKKKKNFILSVRAHCSLLHIKT